MDQAHQSLAELLGFVTFFGAANWFAGGNLRIRKRLGLPGRSIYYAGLAAILIGYWLYGGIGALAGASFTFWRLPGWYGALDAGTAPIPAEKPGQAKIFGIDARPLRLRDFIVMSARGLLAFPVFAYVAYRDQEAAPIFALAIASLMTGALYDLAHRYLNNRNDWAEASVGMAWGVAYFVVVAA